MPKRSNRVAAKQQKPASDTLKSWQQIAAFLGQPVSVAQRWAKSGMPVARQGRFVTASGETLNKWLGRESGEPLHVATEKDDLSAELKRGLSFVRKQQKSRND
jgi:hypothetical protein